MAETYPTVTILIAARPGQEVIRAVESSRSLDYPKHLLEVIVARGKQPSVQRNTGLHAAKGDIIYFLDDDSEPAPDNLKRVAVHFADPEVEIVGGPNLCPADAPWIEKLFALVLTSKLAFGPSRARYCKVGSVRPTTEKELILCNLAARRTTLVRLGGFDEALYPNEENALMDNIQESGKKLLYDPEFFVHRRPRPNLKAFAKMLMTYGRGRAEQFRVNPGPGSVLNFVPPLFLLYLLVLTPAFAWLGRFAALPLLAYLLIVAIEAFSLSLRGGLVRGICAAPLVILTHVLYGAGFWRGLFTKLSPPDRQRPPVTLELRAVS